MELNLKECIQEIKKYIDKGCTPSQPPIEKPFTVEEIYPSRFMNIQPRETLAKFLSVDASSYPLIKANNWRIGVSRCAYVIVENVKGRWVVSQESYEDHIFPVVAPINQRKYLIWAKLRKFESQLAIKQLKNLEPEDFCLMDGAAFFDIHGGTRYSLDLYNICSKKQIRLLMIPKNSPILHDDKGRDLLAVINIYSLKLQKDGKLGKCWVYHPIREAELREDLYGDVACVRLSPSSPKVFRCDIMDYLVAEGKSYIVKILSELSSLSMDARCNGYPAPLFLAHQRTKIPKAKLLEYHEAVQLKLSEEGLLDFVLNEAEIASFRKHLLGLTYDFDLPEDIEEV